MTARTTTCPDCGRPTSTTPGQTSWCAACATERDASGTILGYGDPGPRVSTPLPQDIFLVLLHDGLTTEVTGAFYRERDALTEHRDVVIEALHDAELLDDQQQPTAQAADWLANPERAASLATLLDPTASPTDRRFAANVCYALLSSGQGWVAINAVQVQ